MPDNRNNIEISPLAEAPLVLKNNYPQNNYQNNYYDAPDYGGRAKVNQARIATLREWRRIIRRHKWLILSIVLVVVPFTAIHAYRAKAIYEATTTIDVRAESSSLLKSGDVFLIGSGENTKAEAIIIKSLPVIKKTVVSLNLDKNPRFLETTKKKSDTDARASLARVSPKGGRPEQEKGPAREVVKKDAAKDRGGNVTNGADPENDKSSADPVDILPDARSEHVKLEPYVQALLDNLIVEGVRDTRLIKISFTHTDPEIAASVANGIASSFITYNFQIKTERFTNTSNWLEDSTRKLKAQVEEAERKLANYSRENNIFSLEGKENLTADKMVRLHDQAMRAETARLLKQSMYDEVKQGRGAQLPEAFSDPKTAELRKAYNELAVAASQLSVKFGAKHPKLAEIREQMDTLQDQIRANQSMLENQLMADYKRAAGEEGSLKTALRIAKNEAVQQNQAAIQYSILQQDLTTAKGLYTDFLNKTSQANIQRAEQFNNVHLIEAAEPPSWPIGPNRYQPILLALILSLALGIGLAYLLESLNTTLRTVEDATRATQLPMLAVIPALTNTIPQVTPIDLPAPARARRPKNQLVNQWVKKILQVTMLKEIGSSLEQLNDHSDKLAVADSTRSVWAAAEAYRMLRTSIMLSAAGGPPKTVLVTSGQPGDGKTTTVLNIAFSLAQLNAEVVIVDCDMRKPGIHELLQLANGEGLSTFLTSGGDLDKFINPTSVPHLSIIPCGAVPPNPSELISSGKMKELLRSLADRFNYVIIDSPPMAPFTDPLILSTMVDGVILVVRSGQSRGELVSRACQDLSGVGAKVLGVTLNDLNIRKEGYDDYRYYHYYSDYMVQNGRTSTDE